MPERTSDAAAPEPENPTPGSAAQQGTPAVEATAPESEPATPDAADPKGEATAPEGEATAPETEGDAGPQSQMPEYKGEPLDAERGPGLGCFWIQVGLLTFFLVFTPLTVTWGWDPLISGALLIITLILLLFTGQTVIFLLRLVAADRRTRRAPLNPSAKPTVGQMEDAGAAAAAPESDPAVTDDGDRSQDAGGRQSKGDDR